MAINNPTTLAYPPLQVPMLDQRGIVTQQWAMWFQQMYIRIGGTTPINPKIPTQPLVSGYPFNVYLVPAGQTLFWNGRSYTTNQIIPFYQSGVGTTTLLDSFVVQNISPLTAVISVYSVPFNNLPSPTNLIVDTVPIPPNSGQVSISQLSGIELGSGAYLAVKVTPSQQLLCTLSGRLLT